MMERITKWWRLLSPQAKSSCAIFLSSLIASGISYITTPIYTRMLTSEEYGRVSLFMTWQNVFGIIAMFSLSSGVFNNGMIEYPGDRHKYSSSMLLLSNFITVIFLVIITIIYPMIKKYVKLEYKYIILMIVCFLTLPAYNFWVQRQRFEYRYKGVFFSAIFIAFISPLFGVAGIVLFENNVWGRLLLSELALSVFYSLFYYFILRDGGIRPNLHYWKFALKFNLPLIPHYLSIYMLANTDRIMISNMVGDSATAYYSVANTLASVVLIIWSAVNASLIPYTYEKLKNNMFQDISKVTNSLLMVFCVVCTLFILISPELVALMATAEYLEAVYVIPPVVAGVFFQVHYSLFANVIYYYKKSHYVLFGSLISVLLNVVLNYYAIKKFGYVAAGYTTLVCYFVQASIDYIALCRTTKEKVYNIKVIVCLSTGMIVVSSICVVLYHFVLIRYIIIILCIIVFLLFFKKIKGVYDAIQRKEDTE